LRVVSYTQIVTDRGKEKQAWSYS